MKGGTKGLSEGVCLCFKASRREGGWEGEIAQAEGRARL